MWIGSSLESAELLTAFSGTDLVALKGKDKSTGEPMVVIAAETPNRIWSGRTMARRAHELVLVKQLCVDMAARGRGSPFIRFRSTQQDPPDVEGADALGRLVGVEVTTWVQAERRERYAKFDVVRNELIRRHPGQPHPLRRRLVYVRMDEGGGLYKRIRRADAGRIADAVWGISSPPPFVTSDHAPQEMRPAVVLDDDVFIFVTMLPNTHSVTRVYDATETEVMPLTSQALSVKALARSLSRLVERKDVPENNLLLVACSAPGRDGLAFPSEDVLLTEVLRSGELSIQPRHLKRVWFHRWINGDVWQAWPQSSVLAGARRFDWAPRPDRVTVDGREL